MIRFPFVEDHQGAKGVKRLCEGVEVSRASYYAWLVAAPARAGRAAADAVLAAKIRHGAGPGPGWWSRLRRPQSHCRPERERGRRATGQPQACGARDAPGRTGGDLSCAAG